ncbi:MAG: DEAD/DEAH box helicase family protein [Actinomycetia bacterium]|nr:DEAD/DEAH box helicase family protein [Actinomycetes bacterium]
MKFQLFDYQRDAALGCLSRLAKGRRDWREDRSRSSFALSAITGAGKTVIATAVIEAILHGSADLQVEPDNRAAFLWVTDDPALNRQTKNKMLASSDLMQPARIRILDDDFLDSSLSAGRVYFLNTQKLSKSAGLSRGGRNLRQYSMWEVLANTIASGTVDLYLVLDEAHRGMQRSSDRDTIVQRIISGGAGPNSAVPVVWGISATIARFTAAMKGVTDRTSYPYVEVDIDKVRSSGLVKDEIGLDEPDEKGVFGNTLLREAVKATVDYDRRWAKYSVEQDEPLVQPVLVVQVADKASEAHLTDLISVIESEWSGLGPDAIAHVFGEHERLHLGGRAVDWVQPESIEGDRDVRVVLAKTAISTGWDCPRAEVLYSERPAKDVTHIAQVIGRMVRSPLTHRIATDDVLNSVACFLPLFDRTALEQIKAELEGVGVGGAEVGVGPSVVRAPKVFERNPHIDAAAFSAIAALPSLPAPDVLASPLRRAKELTRLLTDTASGAALLPDAGKKLTKALMAKLDGLAAQYADEVAANIKNIETASLARTFVPAIGAGEARRTSHEVATHFADIERDTRRLINSVKEGVGKDYFAYCVRRAGDDEDRLDVRVACAALFLVGGVVAQLEAEATKWVQDRLAQFAVDIKNTTGAARDAYRRVQEQTSLPELVSVDLRNNLVAATRTGKGDDLPTYSGHLYSGAGGKFPADLNGWESAVIAAEVARPTFVAWYRNPARPTPSSLRIAYKDDAGNWGSVQVDFLVVSRKDDETLGVSIVDPHSDHLADAAAKLQGLANYAEQHGTSYVRIESIAKASDGTLRVLDLQSAATRQAVAVADGAQVSALYDSELARPFL